VLKKHLTKEYSSRQPNYVVATPSLTPITVKSVCRPHNHIFKSRVDGAIQSRIAA